MSMIGLRKVVAFRSSSLASRRAEIAVALGEQASWSADAARDAFGGFNTLCCVMSWQYPTTRNVVRFAKWGVSQMITDRSIVF